jgi:hypothetical protein
MIVAFYSQASYTGKDSCADFAAEWCRERGIACAREDKLAAIDAIKHDGYVLWRNGKTYVEDELILSEGDAVSGRDFIIGLLGSPGKGNGIRGLQEKFWTHQVLNRDVNGSYDSFTLVSDMRFQEEAESVIESGGVVIEVVRPGAPTFNEQRLSAELVRFTITNDGTLEELQAQVEHCMETISTDEARQ